MSKKIIINCACCGNEFEAPDKRTKFCNPECKRIVRNKRHKENYHERRECREQEELQSFLDYRRRVSSLAEINAEARKRGMTYGQYVTYLHFHKNI